MYEFFFKHSCASANTRSIALIIIFLGGFRIVVITNILHFLTAEVAEEAGELPSSEQTWQHHRADLTSA